jgi:hypothetical protein
MKRLVSSLVVVFILIMTLAEGCVRSAAGEPAGPQSARHSQQPASTIPRNWNASWTR